MEVVPGWAVLGTSAARQAILEVLLPQHPSQLPHLILQINFLLILNYSFNRVAGFLFLPSLSSFPGGLLQILVQLIVLPKLIHMVQALVYQLHFGFGLLNIILIQLRLLPHLFQIVAH